jgi:hypothetical protein
MWRKGMKEEHVKNEYYEILIDREKNRSYIALRGYWPSLDVVPNLQADFLTVPERLQPQYTSLIDLREFKTPGPDVMNMFIAIENENAKVSVRRKAARVVTQPLEKLAADRIGKDSGVQEQTAFFNSLEEAEAWLDE